MFDDARERHDFEAEIERSLRRTISDFMREGGIPLPFLSHVEFRWVDHQMALNMEFRYSNGHRALMRYYVRWRHGPGHFSQSPLTFVDQIARRYSTLANDAVPGMVLARTEPFSRLSYNSMETAAFEMRTTPWLEAAEQHWREHHSRMARMAPPPVPRYERHRDFYAAYQRGYFHVDPAPVPVPPPFDQVANYQQDQKALRKSFVLLHENLSEAQQKTLLTNGYIDVLSQRKNRYRIFIGSSMNIMRLTKEGVPATGRKNMLCIVPQGDLPEGDVMLCQKLGLELQEHVVMERGNAFTYDGDGISRMHHYAFQRAVRIKRLLDDEQYRAPI